MGAIPARAGVATWDGLSAHPDAELFRLIDGAREADARLKAAEAACDEAGKRTENVPAPQALIVTEEDTRLWKLNVGDLFDGSHIDLMGKRQTHRRSSEHPLNFSSILADAPYIATLDEKDRATLQLMAARETREDQLIAARDQWQAARRLAQERSAETAAEERQEQLYNERGDACDRIARKRALTLSGLLAKLAFVAPDFEHFELEEELEGGTSEVILTSIAVDFNSLKPALAAV